MPGAGCARGKPTAAPRRHARSYCDAFVERDNLYIVMEFAEGGDIGRQVEKFKKANKYIKEDHIWSYIIQLCRALNELHSRNVLHRVRGPGSSAIRVWPDVRRASPAAAPPIPRRRTSNPRTSSSPARTTSGWATWAARS